MEFKNLFDFDAEIAIGTSEDGDFFFYDALKHISNSSCGYFGEDTVYDWYYYSLNHNVLADWYNEGRDINTIIMSLWKFFLDDMEYKVKTERKFLDDIDLSDFIAENL